jgi:predicted dehydrogenase
MVKSGGDLPLRFAVVGCGAIAESYFLPVLTKRRDLCSALSIIDANPARLAAISNQFGISSAATSLNDVLETVDAAVIATPHDTHFELSKTVIAAGKHVLCEKPLTTAPEEAAELVAAAERAKVVLMTNNWRRNSPAFREVKRIIKSGSLGRPVAVSWNEGRKFAWPTKSGFYFTQRPRNNLPPPGILLDVGSHVIDLLCWWFGSEPVVTDCRTDSFGGPEARATLALDFAGVTATAEFSYYQKLTNKYRIEFEGGCITGVSGEEHCITVSLAGKIPAMVRLPRGRITVLGHATQMIANFAGAVAGANPPLVTGADVLPSIRVIAQGYRQARAYDAWWLPRLEN